MMEHKRGPRRLARFLENRNRFVGVITLLLALGFFATILTSHLVARDSLSDHISGQMLPLTSDNVYSEIQRDLLRPILISSLMAHDTFVRNWALAGERDPERISEYLEEIRRKFDTITAFFVSNRTLHYYHPRGVIKTMDPADPDDDWYFRLRDYGEPYEINVDRDTADRSRLNIFINYRVFDDKDEFLGVTGVGLSVNAVVELIETYQRRYGRLIYFVDRQGEVTLHGENFSGSLQLRQRLEPAELSTRVLASPSTSFTYTREDGDQRYLNSRLVPEFGWYLVVEQHGDTGRQRLDRTLMINILLSLLVTAAVLLVAWFTLSRYQRRLMELATTDELSGASNRQAFDNIVLHAIKVARRRGEALSLLAMDFDHFKTVNDRYGHQGGDKVIQVVSQRIRDKTRDSDVFCRWGGEEFLLLLQDCDLDHALERAEVVRRYIKEQPVRYGRDSIQVTLSIGVAQWQPGDDLDAVVSRADAALYEAKTAGRDCVRRG